MYKQLVDIPFKTKTNIQLKVNFFTTKAIMRIKIV